MSIDAKDLHALYAPLWQKVPETRPKHVSFEGEEAYAFTASVSVLNGSGFSAMIPAPVAADACRCALVVGLAIGLCRRLFK